jgi:molecular chaperone DnaK
MSVVGIDLGTTYSSISYLDAAGKPCIVPLKDGGRMLPSLIYYDVESGGELRVGQIAEQQSPIFPERVAGNFKRFMGKDHVIKVLGKDFSPTALSAVILKKLRQDFEQSVGPITSAVISVPAHFETEAREATLEAARIAKIPCSILVNEPTAAILSASLTKSLQGKVLVFDLGGGTFDVTLAEVKGESVEVLSSEGDLDLGGRHFDMEILLQANEGYLKEHGEPLVQEGRNDLLKPNSLAFRQHQTDAESVKKTLSAVARTPKTFLQEGKSSTVDFSRKQFEDRISTYLAKASTLVDVVLENAGMDPCDVNHVVLVGGSTRVPAVHAQLKKMFDEERVISAPNVDEAVCLGAAIRAGLEAADGELSVAQKIALASTSLLDVTNKNYGTLSLDGASGELKNSIILRKDTQLPCKATDTFFTVNDNQTEVECKVTECSYDERDPDLVTIKKSAVLKLPPGRSAGQEIRVTYSYDVNQVVHCEFFDVASGRRQEIQLALDNDCETSVEFEIDDFVIE